MVRRRLCALVLGLASFGRGATPEPSELFVRLSAPPGVDSSIVSGASLVSHRLLGDAGVALTWRVCGRDQCETDQNGTQHVIVILRSQQDAHRNAACGRAARGGHDGAGTIIMSVPCVARVAFELSRSAAYRGHPRLAMPRHDDLLGLVIAHEIAHLLGLGHASSGVMRRELLREDLLALRAGTLAPGHHEAARLQSALKDATTRIVVGLPPALPGDTDGQPRGPLAAQSATSTERGRLLGEATLPSSTMTQAMKGNRP